MAVVEKATLSRRVNSCARSSYCWFLVAAPRISMIRINSGTPTTKAPNIKCSCAITQTATRRPTTGKSP